MKYLVPFVLFFMQSGFAQEEEAVVYGKCDVGPCELIPGLVYDSETKQCSWPDEVGCSLEDLGYASDCGGNELHDVKALDFELNLPDVLAETREQNQYFVVCVPYSTDNDISERARSLEYKLPTGPLVPRLLGCPDGFAFNAETKSCDEN